MVDSSSHVAVSGDPLGTISSDARGRVVIADDDDDIRFLVAIAVRKAGLDLVGNAADGNAAWAAIQREKPRLVVLDISMPGYDGIELCRLIREDDALARTRVLLLSAGLDEGARRAATAAGVNQMMDKPFSPGRLALLLTELAAAA